MTRVTCRLTAKNRDQLLNPTLGNRVWATFTFLVPRGGALDLRLTQKTITFKGFDALLERVFNFECKNI